MIAFNPEVPDSNEFNQNISMIERKVSHSGFEQTRSPIIASKSTKRLGEVPNLQRV
jgi:hypothetical protein